MSIVRLPSEKGNLQQPITIMIIGI